MLTRAMALALAVPVLAVPIVGTVPAAAAVTCQGRPATIEAADQRSVRGTPGDDVVVVRNVVRVSTGAGDDLLCITGRGMEGYVLADTGPGDDLVDARRLTSRTDVQVQLGAGDDRYLGATDNEGSNNVTTGDGYGPGRDVVRIGKGGGVVYSGVRRATNPDVIDLGRSQGTVFLRGRPAGRLSGGGERFTTLVVDDSSRVAWRYDWRTGVMTTGGGRAVVRGFPSVVLRDTRFTSLVGRGTDGPQYLEIVRGPSAPVGRVDVDLRGGRDSFTAVGPVTGRVDLGSGDRDSYSSVRSDERAAYRGTLVGSLATGEFTVGPHTVRLSGAEKVFASSFRRVVLEGDRRDNELVATGCTARISGRGGDDAIAAYSPVRRCPGRGAGAELRGQDGDDRLLGTGRPDVLLGGRGRDEADGRGGDDRCAAEVVVRC